MRQLRLPPRATRATSRSSRQKGRSSAPACSTSGHSGTRCRTARRMVRHFWAGRWGECDPICRRGSLHLPRPPARRRVLSHDVPRLSRPVGAIRVRRLRRRKSTQPQGRPVARQRGARRAESRARSREESLAARRGSPVGLSGCGEPLLSQRWPSGRARSHPACGTRPPRCSRARAGSGRAGRRLRSPRRPSRCRRSGTRALRP